VDGSSNKKGNAVGIVLEGPRDIRVEQSLVCKFKTSNNQTEYEALIVGLHLAEDMRERKVTCKTDSQLMVGQIKGELQDKEPLLLKYHQVVKRKMKNFDEITLEHVSHE